MRRRLLALTALVAVWVGAIGVRLWAVQVAEHGRYAALAEVQQQRTVEVTPPRGTIFDARGRRLAASAEVESAYAIPGQLPDAAAAAAKVAAAIGADRGVLERRFASSRKWVVVGRKLESDKALALRALELPGLGFFSESKRFYPLGSLAAPVLGFVGLENRGLAGLEARYDGAVAGRSVRRTLLTDALQSRVVAGELAFADAERGDDLYLTLDATIQHVVERELERARREHGAASATAVLIEPRTGAVLAMATVPGFDPNRFNRYPKSRWRNRAIQDVYEPGSTFKLVTAAAVLGRDLIDPLDQIDCENGAITLGRTRIRDHKPFATLSFREVVAKSSNVGAIKLGLMVGRAGLYEEITRLGFGAPTGIDLPGESAGLVHPLADWWRNAEAYMSIGQGVSVTNLQLAVATAAIANGGVRVRPHVVAARGRDGQRRAIDRPPVSAAPVLSRATVRSLVRLMEAVVEEGTGRAAAVPGYRVAGKTGTAQKSAGGRGYAPGHYVASFAGFAPSRAPRVVAVIAIDEPRGKYHGGDVAAPVFAAVMRQVVPYLGAPPERRAAPPSVATAAPGARREPAPRATAAGELPDLTGLSARQAVARSAALGLTPRLHGAGFVARQEPAAGTALAELGGTFDLWLATEWQG